MYKIRNFLVPERAVSDHTTQNENVLTLSEERQDVRELLYVI